MALEGKFVVRLLGSNKELLAWAEVHPTPRAQERAASGLLVSPGPTMFHVEQDGRAEAISVHWCELDCARLKEIAEPVDVKAGDVLRFDWLEPLWIVPGMRDVPLPAVTIGSRVVGVPAGSLAARDREG